MAPELVVIAAGGGLCPGLDEGVSLLEERCFYLFIEHKEIFICVSVLHKFKMHLIPFSVFRTFDRNNDNCISVVEWVEGLSVFLRGTLEERIKCKVYLRAST